MSNKQQSKNTRLKNKSSSKRSNQTHNYNLKKSNHSSNEKSSTNYVRYDASPLSMSSSSLPPINSTNNQTISSSKNSITIPITSSSSSLVSSASKKANPSKNTHTLSSSLQIPKVTKTLLGFPDGNIPTDQDTDPYVTKIGGIPNWFASSSSFSSPELSGSLIPSFGVAICGNCGKEMFLLFQGYVPLDRSPYDRIIYVWGCNQQRCMRKSGSFRAIRAHRLNKEYAQQLRQDKEKYANAIAPPAFNLKELLLSSNNHSNTTSLRSIEVTTTSDYEYPKLESTVHRKISEISSPKDEIPPSNHNKNDSHTSSKNWSQIVSEEITTSHNKDEKEPPRDINDLSNRIQKLELVDSSSDFLSYKEWPKSISHFPAQYLYITEEILEENQNFNLLKKYEQYLNYEDYNNCDDGNLGEWAGEKYEKSVLPKGVDKAFKKFSKRVAEWPDQCVRYEFGGQPLLYNQNYLTGSENTRIPPCKNCGKDRVFEFQLMPNTLYALSTSKYARIQSDEDDNHHNAYNIYQFNLGMEWGTVIIFTCVNDCSKNNNVSESNDDNKKTFYYEEYVFVQYENSI